MMKKSAKDYWQELEEQLRKPRKQPPKVRVSGRSVLRLAKLIAQKSKTKKV